MPNTIEHLAIEDAMFDDHAFLDDLYGTVIDRPSLGLESLRQCIARGEPFAGFAAASVFALLFTSAEPAEIVKCRDELVSRFAAKNVARIDEIAQGYYAARDREAA